MPGNVAPIRWPALRTGPTARCPSGQPYPQLMTDIGKADNQPVTCMMIVRDLASVVREPTDLGAS